jgi:hypothetical protein
LKGGVVHERTLRRRICVNCCVVHLINHRWLCMPILLKKSASTPLSRDRTMFFWREALIGFIPEDYLARVA